MSVSAVVGVFVTVIRSVTNVKVIVKVKVTLSTRVTKVKVKTNF